MSEPHQKPAKSHEDRVAGVLARVHRRQFRCGETCHQTGHPIDYSNPLEELIQREELALVESTIDALEITQQTLGLDILPEPLMEKIREAVFDHFRQLEDAFFQWFFAGGPHPLFATQRLFAAAKHHDASLVWNMSFRDLGDLFDETGSNVHARQDALFGELPAGWRKGRDARDKMRASAMGNACRRGGKKAQGNA